MSASPVPESFERQVRCPNCGAAHPNPDLCDSYRYCLRCFCVLRATDAIDISHLPKPKGPLLIIAASYGHPNDASLATDVRELLQQRVEMYGAKDRLHIKELDHLLEQVFKGKDNPCPGVLKTVRVRFQIDGRRSEVLAHEDEEFHLASPGLYIVVPRQPPTLVLGSCIYGHPRGLNKGRGAFDVTEILQARVEESGGTFLELSNDEDLKELFGDPCPNRRKNLIINYEIHGAHGKLEEQEVEGRLRKPINLTYTPLIAPLIVIEKATYGLTHEGIQEKIREIQIELYSLTAIESKKALGLPVSAEDNAKLFNDDGSARVPYLTNKLEIAGNLKEGFVDVSEKVQLRVEESGGGKIDYTTTEDLNELFSNPNPGFPKQLRISYTVLGHDSERMTLSSEITYPSGFPRNFIMPRNDKYCAEVVERPGGFAELIQDVYVVCPKVLPTLDITQGFYGHLTNYRKVFDVTAELRQLSFHQGGNKLCISTTDKLYDLFRDPARGVRKVLKLAYTIRGFSGTMRIEEKNGYLKSSIQIGYAPKEGSDAGNRRESRKMSLMSVAANIEAGINIMKGKKHSVVIDNREHDNRGVSTTPPDSPESEKLPPII